MVHNLIDGIAASLVRIGIAGSQTYDACIVAVGQI